MKILGLDIGFSRVGVAIGNDVIGMAFPRETIPFESYLLEIKKIIETENIKKIIIGDPRPMNNNQGDEGKSEIHRQKILREKENIETTLSLPVEVFDERCTTLIAEASLREMGVSAKNQKKSKDSVAAAIILQGWLDSQNKSDHKIK